MQIHKKWWFWTILCLLLLGFVGSFLPDSKLQSTDAPSQTYADLETSKQSSDNIKEVDNKEAKEKFYSFMDEMVNLDMVVKYEVDQDLDHIYIYMTPRQWNEVPNKKDFVLGIYSMQKDALGLYAISVHDYNNFNDEYGYVDIGRVTVNKF